MSKEPTTRPCGKGWGLGADSGSTGEGMQDLPRKPGREGQGWVLSLVLRSWGPGTGTKGRALQKEGTALQKKGTALQKHRFTSGLLGDCGG